MVVAEERLGEAADGGEGGEVKVQEVGRRAARLSGHCVTDGLGLGPVAAGQDKMGAHPG